MPVVAEKAIPKHIADKLKVDLVTNGISLSCVVFGEISIRALVVESMYNIVGSIQSFSFSSCLCF